MNNAIKHETCVPIAHDCIRCKRIKYITHIVQECWLTYDRAHASYVKFCSFAVHGRVDCIKSSSSLLFFFILQDFSI